jgi:rhodanese-related sulfurtransferase
MANYAGDITPERAWEILASDENSVLIDVRTKPEWSFVGVCDLESLNKQPALIEWQVFPTMAVNESFGESVDSIGAPQDAPLLFLCRSGARSRSAAIAATERGYHACYNVAGGFEGDPDGERHRGRVNGWKAAGLPWVQQ